MANEITNNGLKTDLRITAMISQEIRLLLADSTSLRNTLYMTNVGSINGMGSDTIRVRKAGLDGYDADQWSTFAAGTEPDAVPNTALTDSSVDVTVKRRALQYTVTDLAGMTGMGADVDPARMASSIAASYDGFFADMTADAFAAFTDIEATCTGVALSVAGFMGAYQKLQNKSGKSVPGPYVCVLAAKGWGELQLDIKSETGSIGLTPATYETISAKGDNYKGSFLGVEIYTSSFVTGAGPDNLQAMWAPGAIGFATGTPDPVGAVNVIRGDQVTVEFSRNASNASTAIVGHAYLGLSIIDNDRGVLLKSQV
jgi:hypothetical protein